MFRTLIYPSSGACDCIFELPHQSSCSQFVVCWRFGAAGVEWCSFCRLKHNNKNRTTDVVIQLHCRKLLMMDILISETCWAHKKRNKIASDIKLVFHSSTITMMHGPINIRYTAQSLPKPMVHLSLPILPICTVNRDIKTMCGVSSGDGKSDQNYYFQSPVAFETKSRCAFRSSRRWAIQQLLLSGTWHRVVWLEFTNIFGEAYCLHLHGSVASKHRCIITALHSVTFHYTLPVTWSQSSFPSWQSFLLYNLSHCVVCNCQLN